MSLPVLLQHILNIFNRSLESSIFPDTWKHSIITPLPKVGRPKKLKDYRPISLLPILSKVLERLVNGQITSWLTEINLLDV